jgi:hypothetical protein
MKMKIPQLWDFAHNWLVHFGIKKFAGAPFSIQKGGLWAPFGALSPPFKGERVSQKKCSQKLQKEFPPNPTVQKIPTGHTNRLVPVPYRYRPDGW